MGCRRSGLAAARNSDFQNIFPQLVFMTPIPSFAKFIWSKYPLTSYELKQSSWDVNLALIKKFRSLRHLVEQLVCV